MEGTEGSNKEIRSTEVIYRSEHIGRLTNGKGDLQIVYNFRLSKELCIRGVTGTLE